MPCHGQVRDGAGDEGAEPLLPPGGTADGGGGGPLRNAGGHELRDRRSRRRWEGGEGAGEGGDRAALCQSVRGCES